MYGFYLRHHACMHTILLSVHTHTYMARHTHNDEIERGNPPASTSEGGRRTRKEPKQAIYCDHPNFLLSSAPSNEVGKERERREERDCGTEHTFERTDDDAAITFHSLQDIEKKVVDYVFIVSWNRETKWGQQTKEAAF